MSTINISTLLNAAKSTLIELSEIGSKEERKQALKINSTLERNAAIRAECNKSKGDHTDRVFRELNKKLFSPGRKLKEKDVTDFDFDFLTAIHKETEKKAEELYGYTKTIAEIVKKEIPDNISGDEVFKRFTDALNGLDSESVTVVVLLLKNYFCERMLGYFTELSNFSSKQPIASKRMMEELAKRMKDDLGKIPFIVCLEDDDKELKNFQKLLDLPNNFSERKSIKAEAYLYKKQGQTIELLMTILKDEKITAK